MIGKFYTETRYRIQSNVDNASQLPATNTVVENEEDGVNEDICRSVSITLEKKVVPVDSSNVVASRHTIKDIGKNSIPTVIQTSTYSTFYGPCFCNIHRWNETMVVCSSASCRVKTYHRSCLLILGKKRCGENLTCDDCKQQRKKVSNVRKALKPVN